MRTSRYMIAFAALVFVAFHPAFAAGEGSAAKAEGSAEKEGVSLEVLGEGYAATMKALVEVEVLSSKEYLRLPWIPPVVKMRPGYSPQDSGPYYFRFGRSG